MANRLLWEMGDLAWDNSHLCAPQRGGPFLSHCPVSPTEKAPPSSGSLGLTLGPRDQVRTLPLPCRGVLKHHVRAGPTWTTRAPGAPRLPPRLQPGDSAVHL